MKQHRGALALAIIFAVIALDQLLKIWVKTSFYLGEHIDILPFFELRFVENPGMAFGWQLGSKLFLTIFRIVVVAMLAVYLYKLRHLKKVPAGYVVCVALIIAGAAGNIFDCVVYGQIFTDPMPPAVAHFVSWGHGYAPLFHGKVVDMLYFPLFSFVWPAWMPLVGGETFSFFDPVFNLADSAITVGILAVIFFYRDYVLVTTDEEVERNLAKRAGDEADKDDTEQL